MSVNQKAEGWPNDGDSSNDGTMEMEMEFHIRGVGRKAFAAVLRLFLRWCWR